MPVITLWAELAGFGGKPAHDLLGDARAVDRIGHRQTYARILEGRDPLLIEL